MSNDVTNLRDTILAKSDQLNADDIIGTGITITVTAVKRGDSAEQPVVIHYQGDNGRPYKPCKTMRRVLIAGWGEKWRGVDRPQHDAVQRSVCQVWRCCSRRRNPHQPYDRYRQWNQPDAERQQRQKQEVIIQPLKAQAPSNRPSVTTNGRKFWRQ